MNTKSKLENRTLSPNGLSVGTHLALETFFSNLLKPVDTERKFEKAEIDDYKYHIFNAYTIVRNILNSFNEKDKYKILQDREFSNILTIELNLIESLYGLSCTPMLFCPSYTKVIKEYCKNKEKKDRYPIAEAELKFIQNMFTTLSKEISIPVINITNDHRLPKDLCIGGKCLIMTHISVDLFNAIPKNRLYLLESHTGKIKTTSLFYTKYFMVGKRDLSNMPWLEELMYILGDRSIIQPEQIAVRRKLVDLAAEHRWTGITTREKVRRDISNYAHDIYSKISSFKRMYG